MFAERVCQTEPMTTQLIAKCRNGHAVRGLIDLGGWSATTPGATSQGNCWAICPCGQPGAWRCLTVVDKPERACNGVCMGAVGPSCSCSCGGENHGAGRVFTA